VRSLGSAGGPLSEALRRRLVDAFPAAVVWNQYGCTEAGPRLTACPSTDEGFARGSVGRPLEGVELRIEEIDGKKEDEGEVVFRADTAMIGYLGHPGGEWIRTGDLGRLIDGHLFLRGRVDEVVKVRGQKVSLALVRSAAERAGARAAIALAVGDPAEIALAYEGDVELARTAIARDLPLEALPSRLVRLPELPRLPSGKPDRAEVERLVSEAVP
jgi:acyl-CoA synthetase (AMP-forming)/AMP-acid ligase II